MPILRRKQNPIKFYIKWSQENSDLCNQAHIAISSADLEGSLKILSKIHQDKVLREEISHLSSRLAKYQQEKNQGTIRSEEDNVRFNQISESILNLITTISDGFDHEKGDHQKIFEYLNKRYENRLQQKLSNRQPINLT